MNKKQRAARASHRRLASYLATAGATLGSASTGAAILHFDPDPDLFAIDTDVLSPGGREQLASSYDWDLGEGTDDKGDPTYGVPLNFSATASVEASDAPPLPNQLILRTDDFAGTRVAESNIAVGSNLRVALGPRPPASDKDGGEAALINNTLYTAGQMIDASGDWGDDLADDAGDKNAGDPILIDPVPTDGFGLFLGIRLTTGQEAQDKGDPTNLVNYGWIRYSLHDTQVVLHDLALETTPATGIPAGATVPLPGSLPLLASGAAGLAAFRRRRKATRKTTS